MACAKLCFLSLLALGALVAAQDEKNGKVWSLFSVVSFKNVPCRSDEGPAAFSGIKRNGTCFTSSECTNKGGKSSGNCAAGFGVCCFFAVSKSSSTVTQNNTYIQNPGYPTALTAADAKNAFTYDVKKVSDNICMLRLDFESFTIEGVTSFDDAGVCRDSFTVTNSVKTVTYPVICGVNNGQHMYIDMTRDSGATAKLEFKFDQVVVSTKRTWDIKVAQIECDSRTLPYDAGCVQYLYGEQGRFSTFNFQESTTTLQHHLPAQRYQICVRREKGYCCIEYKKCADDNSYLFDTQGGDGLIGTECTDDYLGISGVSDDCDQGPNAMREARICGGKLTAVIGGKQDSSVCDCTAPFAVEVNFDAAAAFAGSINQRGICLEYSQHPCNN